MPTGARVSSLPHSVKIISGAHPALSAGVKQQGWAEVN